VLPLSTAPQFSISQKALGTLPEDGNVMAKYIGSTIHNKLNEQMVHLLVFQAYINETHGSRSKIPSKKSRQAALRG
jgi:iron-sulfur cluster repair protein YtfE (RIC family)